MNAAIAALILTFSGIIAFLLSMTFLTPALFWSSIVLLIAFEGATFTVYLSPEKENRTKNLIDKIEKLRRED